MGARRLQEVGIEVTIRVWGLAHQNTLAAMNNLAMTYLSLGELDSASSLLERVLELHGQNAQADQLQVLTTLNNLAQVRRAQGKIQEAKDIQRRVLDGRRWHLGEEHPSTITAINNLGLLCFEEGRFAEARALYEQAMGLLQRTVGEENLSTLTTMANLALVLRAEGKLADARAMLERVLAHQVRLLGKQHPDTLTTLGNLATVLGAQGYQDQARTLEEETLQRSIELFGREHPRTITAMTNLAETQRGLGHSTLARDGQQQALELARRVLGATHPQTLAVMSNLAGAFNDLGEWNAAKSLLEQVLEARTHVLGEAHPRTMDTLRTLARSFEQAGDLDSALSHYARLLRLQTKHLGESHPNTQDTRAQLAKLQQQQSQTEESETSEDEGESEEPSGLPDIQEVQDALFSDFLNNPSPELDVLSSSTEIDSVDVQTLEEDPEHPGEQRFRGSGDVYIIRHYGKGDDADAFSDNFPFQFTLERHFDGRLQVLGKPVDPRSFYGVDPDDEDLKEEADSSRDESRLTSEAPTDEDSPFIEEEPEEHPAPVFVSFSYRDDREYASTLMDWARAGLIGKEVAILEPDTDTSVGELGVREGVKALLNKARLTLLLVGNNTHTNRWVEYEISHMLSARKPVIVVRVPGTTGAAPVGLRRYPEIAFEPRAIARAIREALSPF